MLAIAFIGEEYVGFLVNERTADRASKLIQVKRLLRCGDDGNRLRSVEGVVAKKLERVAVPLIGSRGRSDGQLRASGSLRLRRSRAWSRCEIPE